MADKPLEEKPTWHHDLSEYELQRLQFFVLSGRINDTLIEVLDFWTDLAFLATLFVFSQPGNPAESFLGVIAATSGMTPLATEERDFGLFNDLFIAGAFFLVINIVARIFLAVSRAVRYKDIFQVGSGAWARWFVGMLICIIEPHNGLLFIDSIVKKDAYIRSDYKSTKEEIKLNSMLLFLEDLPQFILQIIFATNVSRIDLTISWYVSTLITVLKLTSAFGGISIMALRLSKLRTKSTTAVGATY